METFPFSDAPVFKAFDFHGSCPSSLGTWDWAYMTQGTGKSWVAALNALPFPSSECSTFLCCLLRLAYLKCSFRLEPKLSELIFCLTKNSNISSQIWRPKCSHFSWKIWVPNERLPLKLTISDEGKAHTIYLFRHPVLLGWRQPFGQGRATNLSLEGWGAQAWRFALCIVLSGCSSAEHMLNFKQMLKPLSEFRSQQSWAR